MGPVVGSIMGFIWDTSPPGGGQTENITVRYPSHAGVKILQPKKLPQVESEPRTP